MAQTDRSNLVLATLPPESARRLEPLLERIAFADGEVICQPGDTLRYAYFPGTAIISMIQVMHEGSAAEIGMVGREGFFGLEAVLREGPATGRAVCQIPGGVWRIALQELRQAARKDEALRSALLRYAGGFCAMLAQLIACNRLHRVERRAARWLLMTYDRTGEPVFPMTQERLGVMLGAQRPTVTAVMTTLREAGCVESTRGQVRITDRKCLQNYACECYEVCAGYFNL